MITSFLFLTESLMNKTDENQNSQPSIQTENKIKRRDINFDTNLKHFKNDQKANSSEDYKEVGDEFQPHLDDDSSTNQLLVTGDEEEPENGEEGEIVDQDKEVDLDDDNSSNQSIEVDSEKEDILAENNYGLNQVGNKRFSIKKQKKSLEKSFLDKKQMLFVLNKKKVNRMMKKMKSATTLNEDLKNNKSTNFSIDTLLNIRHSKNESVSADRNNNLETSAHDQMNEMHTFNDESENSMLGLCRNKYSELFKVSFLNHTKDCFELSLNMVSPLIKFCSLKLQGAHESILFGSSIKSFGSVFCKPSQKRFHPLHIQFIVA